MAISTSLFAEEMTEMNSGSNIEERIASLNSKYLNSFERGNDMTHKIATERLYLFSEEMPRLPQNSYEWEKFWGIAQQDAKGARIGARLGGIIGGLRGKIIGGVIGAVVGSVNAYVDGKDDATIPKAEQPYYVRSTQPIFDFTEPVFDDTITCANAGVIHNTIIQDIFAQDNVDVSNENEVIDCAIRYCQDSLSVEFEDEGGFVEAILEAMSDETDVFEPSDVNNIISFYFDCAPQLTGTLLENYTEEFMRIVHEEFVLNNGLEEEAIIVNTVVSVGYYSYKFWNLNLPNPYTASIFSCYDLSENTWSFVARDYFSYYLEEHQMENIVIGVPAVADSVIETIYFYDLIPECQSVYVDSLLTHENYIRSTNLTFHYTPAFCSFSSGEYDIFRNEAEGITTLEKR